MKKLLFRRRGFTLIEIVISSVIIAIVLGGLVSFGAYAYRQYVSTRRLADMKTDVENIRSLMQGDIDRGGRVRLDTNNRGVTVTLKGKPRSYFYRDGAVFLNDGRKERKLSNHPVSDAVWTLDNGIITMNIVYQYESLSSRKAMELKIIRDVNLDGEGGES